MIDEGFIKFRSLWHRTPPLDNPGIDAMISWRRPLYAAGLIGHFADIDVGFGNISMRVSMPGQFIISGTQTGHLGDLGHEHFALVMSYDLKHNSVECMGPVEASSESMTHAVIYELNPDFRAVVHVHSEKLWSGLRDSFPTTAEGIDYGTPQMAQEFYRLYRETEFARGGVVVMAGHEGGLISTGNSIREAAERILSLHRRS